MLCAMGVSPPKPPVLRRMRMRRKPKAPRRFLAEVCASLGACELRRLLRSCCRPLRSALRASWRRTTRPRSLQQRLAHEGFSMTPSPFCADGFFVGVSDTLSCQEPKLGESLLHLSGEVYGQEATSTLPVEALRMAALQKFGHDAKLHVLDLCAAPGSKASQVASQLRPESLVVNEPRKERAALLQANLLRAGVAEALVLCLDGQKVGALAPKAFNVVLVDAPCSGEGTVRKDPTAWDRWAQDNSLQLQSRCDLQQELLGSAWEALQPGGLLVYSTCTLNNKENEMQCCWLQEQGAKVISLGAQPMATKKGFLRVWPHLLDAEGFFVACFCKDADNHPELDKTKDADADAFESLDLRRLRPSEVTLLKQRVRQELQYLLPEGILVADEQGNVFLLPRHSPRIRGLLPHALTLGLRLTTQQRLSKELRLVAGGNLSSQEWMELHSSTGGGLSAASLALKRAENAPAAAAAFQEMLQQRLTPDQVSYNTLLDAHAKSADGTGAHQVLNEMINTSVAPGVVSFIVIEAYARAGDRAAAEEVFKSMQRFNVQPNQITYTALLRARLEAGDLAAAERLESHLNLVGYTLLIDAYARLGKCVKAEETFEALTQRGLTPNLATYTALMKAYAKAHHPHKAEEVLDRLKAEGLEPNALSYLTLINAHSKEGDLRRAEELYSEQGPSLASATAMISAYGRAKDAAKAQEVFDQLRAQSIRPDAVCARQLSQAFSSGYLL